MLEMESLLYYLQLKTSLLYEHGMVLIYVLLISYRLF